MPPDSPPELESSIITRRGKNIMALTSIHPGGHLAEELKELGMSAAELARKLDVPANRITGILNGSAPSRATLPCVSPISSAQARSSGLTCKASMNFVSPRRRRGDPSGISRPSNGLRTFTHKPRSLSTSKAAGGPHSTAMQWSDSPSRPSGRLGRWAAAESRAKE
jgi:Helix-turn-helix